MNKLETIDSMMTEILKLASSLKKNLDKKKHLKAVDPRSYSNSVEIYNQTITENEIRVSVFNQSIKRRVTSCREEAARTGNTATTEASIIKDDCRALREAIDRETKLFC